MMDSSSNYMENDKTDTLDFFLHRLYSVIPSEEAENDISIIQTWGSNLSTFLQINFIKHRKT